MHHNVVYLPTYIMFIPTSIVDMGHLVDQFIEYWLENLPDMSDFPDIPPSMVQFWKKKRKGEKVNKHRRKREHVTLRGQLGLGRHTYFFLLADLSKIHVHVYLL